jgi:ATP-dependent helicase HrpA
MIPLPPPVNDSNLSAVPLPLRIAYDPALPITAHREEILQALVSNPVLVVCGATGSGKSTQLPKLCLEAGRGTAGLLGHTQPRRIAARALAARLAEEMGTKVGAAVGYQVRFHDRSGPQTRVKLMTDGILLRELERDRNLRRYDTLIIDEAHERSLNIDLLLGVLKRLVKRRRDLRLIVTSATIDPGRFAQFFDGAPVIEVSGRSYPVEVRYRPPVTEDEYAAELSLPEAVLGAVRELGEKKGDTLVFLPGEKHIREAADVLQKAKLADTEILPLFARLSARDQERIFARTSQRQRVVLATNVAETSLTVPGIRFVVDSGLARISRYSTRANVQRLPIERISKASADQRKGRCGREAPGICIRLYSQEDFEAREEFTPPEVLRTNLASVILRMSVLGLGEPEEFPFIDPPDTRLVNDGVRLLQELKAMDGERRVTPLGRQLAFLPLDPRLARMLVAAGQHGCLTEMLVIAAFLETQDPRERPADAQKLADEKHVLFADKRSDFITALNLWRAFTESSPQLSGNQLRKWCREHYLSFVRMREWQDLHSQLTEAARELKLRRNRGTPSYAALHRAILTGFLGSIGRLNDKREYDGARGARFVIAPGTPLATRRPSWVVAASLVETTKLYARIVAGVQPQWIESAASHLLKRSYSEAHWLEQRGYVAAYETVTLYGLTLIPHRQVNYGQISPQEAREIFIREALVEGRARTRHPFLEANLALRAQIEQVEAKIRRRDVLVEDAAQAEFYLQRVPPGITTVAGLEHWLFSAENSETLRMSAADLSRRAAPEANAEAYPEEIAVGANRLPLHYRFDPGAPDDGITLTVPEGLLGGLNPDRVAWLVPGLREEKITAVLRALPKGVRKLLVPVPEHARVALRELDDSGGFFEGLAAWVTRHTGTPVNAMELVALPLDDYLRMNFRVVDAEDHVIEEGRDLVALKRKLRVQPAEGTRTAATPAAAEALHRRWDFGDLPERHETERHGLKLVSFIALEDRGAGTALVQAHDAAEADAISRAGLTRLAMLALPQQAKYLRSRFADSRALVLLSQGVSLAQPLTDALVERAFRECFVPEGEPIPRDEQAFAQRVEARRGDLAEVGDRLAAQVETILHARRGVRAALSELQSPAFADAVADVESQLAGLLGPRFIEETPRRWLDEFPRYFKAITRRLDRLRGNVARDAELAQQVRPFVLRWQRLAGERAVPYAARATLQHARWMIEEFRVSLFAQDLSTALRVSAKRLEEQFERAVKELNA